MQQPIYKMEDLECVLCSRQWTVDAFSEGPMQAWGTVVDKNVFCYGLAGCYEIINPTVDVFSGQICNTCLKDISYQEHFGIACDQCHQQFQGADDRNDKQGFGCSSEVDETRIYCGWGSKYDSERITFVTKRPDDIQVGSHLCDTCITKFIEDGVCCYRKRDYHSVPPISTPPK